MELRARGRRKSSFDLQRMIKRCIVNNYAILVAFTYSHDTHSGITRLKAYANEFVKQLRLDWPIIETTEAIPGLFEKRPILVFSGLQELDFSERRRFNELLTFCRRYYATVFLVVEKLSDLHHSELARLNYHVTICPTCYHVEVRRIVRSVV